MGDTIDISAHDTRIRNDGVVDVFANEAARVTTQSMALSVGEEVQIMGGEKVVMTTPSLALNADTTAGLSAGQMLASVDTSLTATVGSATQLTAADVSVDAGNDVRVSGTTGSNAYVGTDNAHVSTAA